MHRKEGFENRDLGSGKERGKVAMRLKRGKEGKEKEWKREKRGYKRERKGTESGLERIWSTSTN